VSRHHQQQRQAAAFSLVEVALALGLAAFCLVAVFGLLPVGINNNHASIEQSAAAGIGAALAADLRNTALPPAPATTDQTTPYYGLTIPANPASTISTADTHFIYLRQDGSRASAQDQALDPTQNPRYLATLYYTSTGTAATGGPAPKNAVQARILITWPPQVSPTSGAVAGAFETITTVPRN
jgi:uncharacterized protein (TIGR02598 family)